MPEGTLHNAPFSTPHPTKTSSVSSAHGKFVRTLLTGDVTDQLAIKYAMLIEAHHKLLLSSTDQQNSSTPTTGKRLARLQAASWALALSPRNRTRPKMSLISPKPT